MKKYLPFYSSFSNCLFRTNTDYIKALTIIAGLVFSFYSKAQVFTGTGGAILNNGQDTYFNLAVTGLPTQLDSTFGIEKICISINHPALEELYIYLESPGGTLIQLTAGNSMSGTTYTNTCFDSRVDSSVTQVNSPYSGTYKPMGYLGRFNNGQLANGTWKLVVHDYLAFVNSGSVMNWDIAFGNSPPKAVTFTSSNLPIITINTGTQTIVDTDILVNMGIIYNGPGQRNHPGDSPNNYNAKTTIHIHGNSTRNFEKKSFTLETRDMAGAVLNASLLGMPAENDWDLIAPYQDKSLAREPLTYDLYRQMGHYSARFRNVEVMINNEYRGVYMLMEKTKRDSNRIDISKLTPTDNTSPDVTGGYIIKIDRPEAPGWNSLLSGNSPTGSHFYYQYVYPKDSDITTPQKDYIKSVLDNFETVMNASYFADPATGYQKYIDESSFIDFFIMNELSKNVDAYRLSTYLYKDKVTHGGKLCIGPVWDYNIAWHNCNYGDSFDPMGWEFQTQDTLHPSPMWWSRFFQDSNFMDKVYCRWHSLRSTILNANHLNAYIDSIAGVLNESQQRNFTQWPILGTYIYPNPQSQSNATYQSEINDFKTWIANRIPWLDANINGTCQSVGIEEQLALASPSMNCFPNPFSNNLSITYKIPENLSLPAQVKIELINLIGDKILLLSNTDKTAGTYKEESTMPQLGAGMYMVKLSINNDFVFYQKLVKL
jgi:subtilisin-like proprotein convertase family protein